MEKKIIQIIDSKYSGLSKTNKILADFVKENIRLVPFMSIKELANASGVSEASVTRFTRALSFSGFSEFISCSRQEIQQDLTPWDRIKRTVEPRTAPTAKSSLKSMIDRSIASLNQLYNADFEANFSASVDLISRARCVYIIGARSSLSVAIYLESILNNLRKGVILLRQFDFSQLADIGPEDCLIAIGFARYTQITVETANYCYKQGCPVVAITDGHSSPLALSVEYLLSISPFSNYPVADAMSIAMYLTTAIAEAVPEASLQRMELMEQLGEHFHAYS